MPRPSRRAVAGVLGFGRLYLGFGSWYDHRRLREWAATFNQAELHGQLSSIGIYAKGVGFKLVGDNTRYVFYPRYEEALNGNQFLPYLAAPGDSISKSAHGDTLVLVKQGQVYKYRFKW